jgi:hypothetical protein
MYNSHWWYSRANVPVSAHGSSEFARAANLLYTFRPFTHHYVLSLAYNFLNEGGTAGLIYAARSFAWLVAIGGIPALPWLDDFIEIVEKWTGNPIRIRARHYVKKLAGTTVSRFAGAGMFGVLNTDISAALRPAGIPFLGEPSQSVFGVYSGMAQKGSKFWNEIKLGEVTRAIESISPTAAENVFKAYRLWEKGATTTSKNPVYNEKGEPLRLGTFSALSQAMGIKNYDYSVVMADQWEKRTVLDYYNKKKSNIVKLQHLAETEREREKVYAKMVDFNLSIPPYLVGIVKPVKWQPIQRPDKNMDRLRIVMETE